MQFYVVLFTTILMFSISGMAKPDNLPSLPGFAFSWLNDNNIFEAGSIGIVKIKVVGNFDNHTNQILHENPINLTVTVNDKMGNSSYISGVFSTTEGDPTNWNISFIPISVGTYNLVINDDRYKIFDSSLHFQAIPGRMYPCVSVASWRDLVNEFVAGEKATVLILPRDAFGNNISTTSEEPNSFNFLVSAYTENGSVVNVLNSTYMGWTGYGYLGIEFIAATSGNLSLHIQAENQTVNGSPLPFKVKPGPLDITKCLAKWNYETNALQIFSKLEIFIHQLDQFGNLVPGLNEFDARVIEKETSLSIPIADLYFNEVAPGIQYFSFSVVEPGDFLLIISDMKRNQTISNMPCPFTVFVGYCDGLNSVINGSGLVSSIAGEMSTFSVYLEDKFHNPSPVEAETVRVQILGTLDSSNIVPLISPIKNGGGNGGGRSYASGAPGNSPLPSAGSNNTADGNMKIEASAFVASYTPEMSGTYKIQVFCGNIPLNNGHSHMLEVRQGEVDLKLSGVVKFASKVPKLVENEVVVRLVDSFLNPILFRQQNLSFEFHANSSGVVSWTFVADNNGQYIGRYVTKDIGAYEICVLFQDKHLSPCPFWVYVYSSEYFPKAYNDTVSVWEDESVSFDVLGNDYFAGGIARITEILMPSHGSLLQYERLFRYTPFKGFYGNDTLSYTIQDINNNSASGIVFIAVLITPPQFISLPLTLLATEDVISPRFGGFPGIEIYYSDPTENISISLSAKSGTIFLSPILMQFWQPAWSALSVNRMEGEERNLIVVGCVEVINSVLQSIQYLGNQNFSGDDAIKVSTTNKNGVHDIHIPVFVEPINDPPFINISEFIILEKADKDGSLIFDKQKDKFEYFIGDPDLFSFPSNESHFMISLSLEVNDGILRTNLPANLINTTELKLKNSYQWQPLLTFVSISKHFLVKAKGIRFRGTVKDCNEAIEHLSYHGGEHGAVLTVMANDMGNYGCYPDCGENMSVPLFTEATVNLIRRKPMSSLMAHALGSASVIEFIVIFFLGAILLFFTCKCALVLGNERRVRMRDAKLTKVEISKEPSSSETLSEHVTQFTGCCSSPFLLRSQSSNFRQRSRRQSVNGESGKDESHSSHSSGDHSQHTPLANFKPFSIERRQSGNP
ncbi:Gamete expressed [Thalictrum thalictroides]|uniref:Gamete expressed n=1 Tax=Thalictrum thalictroides TaxID=46969 RepID=A0A7J6WPJ8_THATH|nr:Gamete expressed [Thalictrum thalictroides]